MKPNNANDEGWVSLRFSNLRKKHNCGHGTKIMLYAVNYILYPVNIRKINIWECENIPAQNLSSLPNRSLMFNITKLITIVLLLLLSFTIAQPTQAAFCRTDKENTICILSIKRSAKNYWEYRASVKVNGVTRPIEIYNCRDRTRIKADGKIVAFEPNSAGHLICNVLNK